MVISEFLRTPFLNPSKGKDHNPLTNSVSLAGRGIRGGTVVGESQLIERKRSATGVPLHMALPIHFDSGRVVKEPGQGGFIYPENLAMTLAAVMGVKPGNFASVPGDTKVIPGIWIKCGVITVVYPAIFQIVRTSGLRRS